MSIHEKWVDEYTTSIAREVSPGYSALYPGLYPAAAIPCIKAISPRWAPILILTFILTILLLIITILGIKAISPKWPSKVSVSILYPPHTLLLYHTLHNWSKASLILTCILIPILICFTPFLSSLVAYIWVFTNMIITYENISVSSEGWTTGGGTVIIIGDNFFDGLQVFYKPFVYNM